MSAEKYSSTGGEEHTEIGVNVSANDLHHDSSTKAGGSESSSNETQQVEATKPRTLKSVTWFFVVFSLLAALFLFALDNTIVADVQPAIIGTLGEIDKLPWISVAFALGGISINLLW